MKKVAVIWSSPNTDGLTASAKDRFIAGLTEAGVQTEEIHLNRKKIGHCMACGDGWGTCRSKGACVIQDDFAEIYRKLQEADGIVWVSAVYWWEMTECFKAFFDRLRRCEGFTNRFLEGKRCVLRRRDRPRRAGLPAAVRTRPDPQGNARLRPDPRREVQQGLYAAGLGRGRKNVCGETGDGIRYVLLRRSQ